MKIGYCRSDEQEEIAQLKELGCQKVVTFEPTDNPKELFETVLNEYKDDTIVLVTFDSLKLQLVQCRELFFSVQSLPIDLRFIDKTMRLSMLLQLSKNESSIVTERTTRGIEEARVNGRIGGRPSISTELMAEISFLHKSKKLSLREIADKCNVSLGTAYKYSII